MESYGKTIGGINYSRHSRYKPYYDRKSKSDFGVKRGQQGFSLQKIDWSNVDLKPFKKNFFEDIKTMCENECKKINIDEWRKGSAMTVLSGYKDIMVNDKKRVGYNDFWNHMCNHSNDGNKHSADKHPIIPVPILTFENAHFPDFLMKNIKKAAFVKPTPIQSQAWSMALTGCDVIGIAQTGSGKTLAFLFPAIIHILYQQKLQNKHFPISLIIAPTRELAIQIEGEVQKFIQEDGVNCNFNDGYNPSIRYCCVYGGVSRYTQVSKLRTGIEMIIATPGRLLDFVESGVINLKLITYLIVDEADRLLDMGFEPQLLAIANQIRPDRQTLMFSATWPKQVINLAKKFLTNSNNIFQVIIGDNDLNCNENITQNVIVLESRQQKLSKVKEIIDYTLDADLKSKILVFLATKKSVDWLDDLLWDEGYDCAPIHGGKSQQMRDKAIRKFKKNVVNILIATDVASRGLHIDNINVVINYDFPKNIEDYVHRIGRTGRAGKTGISYAFLTDEDAARARDLVKVLNDNNQEVCNELVALSRNTRFVSKARYSFQRR